MLFGLGVDSGGCSCDQRSCRRQCVRQGGADPASECVSRRHLLGIDSWPGHSPHSCRQYLMFDPILSLGGASSPPWGREVTRRIRHKRLMHEMIYDLSEDQVQFRDVIATFLRKSYGDDERRDIERKSDV